MAQSKQLAKILKGKIWKFFGGIKPQELKKREISRLENYRFRTPSHYRLIAI